MNSPKIKSSKTTVLSADKKGELQNAYLPLQNFINKLELIGDFTSEKLNFDRYTPVDMLVVDEYDGSENIIINDDKNNPKLINTRFSVQENKTFNIPVHSGNAVTNVYEEKTFNKDIQLLKLYDKIPSLIFKGIFQGGNFKSGKYVFYFKLSDFDGNQTNIIQESGIIQIHIGYDGKVKSRMGMENENAEKCIKFELNGIDRGFDYIKIFYERISTDESLAAIEQYYMIEQNYPIRNGKCDILLTGNENILEISKSDIQNEFADIQTAKTQAIVDNTLFLGNISAFEQDYLELQRMSWKIIPRVSYVKNIGSIQSSNYGLTEGELYYSANNVYHHTGYWDDEFYRFGIVYIYNNNILSPVFNIQGCDLSELGELSDALLERVFFKTDDEEWSQEPEDFIFKKYHTVWENGEESKKLRVMTNSKGVIRFPKYNSDSLLHGTFTPTITKISFDMSHIWESSPSREGNIFPKIKGVTDPEEYLRRLGIKGFFFVRQKRIPTIIAEGMVIGLTKKDFGSLPVLKENGRYVTKSFLDSQRILNTDGTTITVPTKNVENKAILIPDYEVNAPILNLIFTGLEFYIDVIGNIETILYGDNCCAINKTGYSEQYHLSNIKLTAVQKETKLITDGENYFSTIAGSPSEPYKTSDVKHSWNKTVPQDLTTSTSLVRGNWGSFVGMSASLTYGDIIIIKDNSFSLENHDLLEYEKRFKDFSLYSSISNRYNISDLRNSNKITCARGDCFKGLFTHRMMSNFIDPELPTNTKIIDPGCWAKNYAVRCTAEILPTTHSNLTGDSGGWYIPTPADKKSAVISLIFGILTGNLGILIKAAEDLQPEDKRPLLQDEFANEIAQAFEVYTGASKDSEDSWDETGGYTTSDTLESVVKRGHIKKVNPQEQESNSSGLNLKAIFKSDDKWELHGLASINRADVNAVSFGQWITFPFCSSYNLSLRDIDFSHATEEASMNKKRAFYPWEEMDPKNHLLESENINGATKSSLSNNQHPAYTTVPYVKQEYFNRIYWSKPNISEAFINSYRIIFKDQYREYNKEFGSITKIVPMGNQLLVVFQHGIGLLPVNRSAQTELELSPFLSSKSVLPVLVNTLTKDYGSMWKDSIIQTPSGIVYGVDTVAKKIWRTTGDKLEFISDHKVSKFLNEWIDLSEYDFNEYQGHINVKTHYNEFKHDVMFTYYRDTPMSRLTYMKNPDTEKVEIVPIGTIWDKNNKRWDKPEIESVEYRPVDLSGNLILLDTLDPKPLIEKWEKGKTWNLCYNEVLLQWTTFYDWYPIESCNIDNIFFSFDKDLLDTVYNNIFDDKSKEYVRPDELKDSELPKYKMNKVFADKMFTENTNVYILNPENNICVLTPDPNKEYYLSLYYKGENPILSEKEETFGKDLNWKFTYKKMSNSEESLRVNSTSYILDCHFTEIKDGEKLTINDLVLKYQELRNLEGPSMYLWKHGQAGLYDNQGKIKPTHWYGKQHEFNVEFIVNQDALILKVFNNLKIISNKTAPNKFEYEIVGEGYDWYELKPVILWINKHATNKSEFESYYKEVLTKSYDTLRNEYANFPELFGYEGKTIKKIPFLHLETCDKYGKQDKSYNQNTDYWDPLRPNSNIKKDRYSFNTSETILVEDDLLNEQRVHTESLGNDIKKYGRLRGNMQYLEDLWDVEIRPIKFKWAYIEKNDLDEYVLKFISSKEARHRDKYIKIKVRYSGEDLAVIQGIITMFDYSIA